MATTYTYTVITQHGEDRSVRRKDFTGTDWNAACDAAVAYAKSFDPDTDGSLCPNVDEALKKREDYERGVFWYGNQYAAIIRTGPNPLA